MAGGAGNDEAGGLGLLLGGPDGDVAVDASGATDTATFGAPLRFSATSPLFEIANERVALPPLTATEVYRAMIEVGRI